jgi:hypothetical protein
LNYARLHFALNAQLKCYLQSKLLIRRIFFSSHVLTPIIDADQCLKIESPPTPGELRTLQMGPKTGLFTVWNIATTV